MCYMDKTEQIIVQLAETYKKPDEFINIVEKSFEVPPNEKGVLFFQVGIVLYKFSYFSLALNSWRRALNYFIRTKGASRNNYVNYYVLKLHTQYE